MNTLGGYIDVSNNKLIGLFEEYNTLKSSLVSIQDVGVHIEVAQELERIDKEINDILSDTNREKIPFPYN